MKRIGNLYTSICTLDNLYIAYQKAKLGKTKTYGVLHFEKNLGDNLIQLQNELISGTYATSAYEVFTIFDPKERIIYRLPFRDRVVHHAIMNILERVWVSTLIPNTYSCIKNRGIHLALKHLNRDLKNVEDTQYCLKMDIRKFYPSINHGVLKTIVRKKIKDPQLLLLLDGIIDSAPGVPIGNYISQFLANIYLSYFDHWLKEDKRVRYYYRYADDMIILNKEKEYLRVLLSEIRSYLKDRLDLDLKDTYQIFPVDSRGIDFVGYVSFHTHILLRKSIKKNLCRKASKLNKIATDAKNYKNSICPWIGWAKHCNSRNLIRTVIQNEKVLDSLI